MNKAAEISPDGLYRYALWRTWDNSKQKVLFIGLNPSTADAEIDDPTIRRCIGFARTWGYGGLVMGNLFAYRATNPKKLLAVLDPIGLSNNWWLDNLIRRVEMVVAAWGTRGTLRNREDYIKRTYGSLLFCLGTTKDGHPRHPLDVRADQPLVSWSFALRRREEPR